MGFKSILTGMVLAATLASGAVAQNVVATDPASMVSFFFDEGVPAQLGVDEVGDPQITLRLDGEEFDIFFYGCTDNRDCSIIQFAQTYSVGDHVTLDMINTWNADNFFLRAYLTPSGSARVEFDVVLGNMGVDTGDFGLIWNEWTSNLEKFASFMTE